MKIERKELLAALEPLKPALATRSSVAELSHVWFDGEYAYAHDAGMGIRVRFESPLKFGVPGALLLGLVNQASADSLTLEETDDALAFKSGRSNVKLATLPVERKIWPYPAKPNSKPVASLKVSEDFLKALKRVFVVHPASPKRMEHHSVCLFAMQKEMDVYTTDSASLAFMPVEEPITGKVSSLAVPRPFAEQISAQCVAGATLEYYSDHYALEASDKISLYSNVFDTSGMEDLPSYADKHSDAAVSPPFEIPKELNATLERAVLMAGPEKSVVKLRTDGKKLFLKGKFKFGELDEEFALTASLPKVSIDVLANILLALKDVNRMMIAPEALTLRGEDGFMYIVAKYGYESSKPREGRD